MTISEPALAAEAISYVSSGEEKPLCPPSVVEQFLQKRGDNLGAFLRSRGYSNRIKSCSFKDVYFNKRVFRNVHFEDCTFERTVFKAVLVSGVRFTSCTFSQSRIHKATMEKVQFEKCHLDSSDFYRSSLKNVTFIDSNLPYSSFTDSQLKKTKFIGAGLLSVSFLGAEVSESTIESSDLTDTLLVGHEKEFNLINCTRSLQRRSVIALGWDFSGPQPMASLAEAIYKTKNVSLLRYPSTHPKVDLLQLQIKVEEGSKRVPKELGDVSKAEHLVRGSISGTEFQKIQKRAKEVVENCDGVNLPGGEDVGEIFYRPEDLVQWRFPNFRRDLLEFCLLEELEKVGKPAIGQCRALQLFNVKKGGTLKNLTDGRGFSKKEIEISSSAKTQIVGEGWGRALREAWGEVVWADSMHHQAVDKLGRGLHVLASDEDIPKLIVNEKGNFLFTQFHPETYVNNVPQLYAQVRTGVSGESEAENLQLIKANEKFFDFFLALVESGRGK